MFGDVWFKDLCSSVIHLVQNITAVDVIDILVVAVLLYYVYKFVRDRRAGKLASGIIIIAVLLIISDLVGMHALQYIFQNIFQVGVIALVILFQPELRSALEKMGASPIRGLRSIGEGRQDDATLLAVREVCNAAGEMSSSKTGALIVFERMTRLGEICATGTVIDAQAGAFLIRNIFFNKAPLHDGAVIIRDGRVYAAGCLLPLSAQNDINRDLGTRHRAAIGLSESCDAVVVVVSEDTGIISLAFDGKLRRGYNTDSLRSALTELVVPGGTDGLPAKKKFFRRKKSVSQSKPAAAAVGSDQNGSSNGKKADAVRQESSAGNKEDAK